jgi:hypothetical protein
MARSRDKDRKPLKAVSPDYSVSSIVESHLATDPTIDRLVEQIVPGLPTNTKDQLVMFVSILRGKGFEIVNCNHKSLKQLVELAKNQTDSLLKDASQ